jgi:hypothetical protein
MVVSVGGEAGMRWGRYVLLAVVAAMVTSPGPDPVAAESPSRSAQSRLAPDREATSALRRLPLHFEENLGQVDGTVSHLVRARGYIAYFTPQQTVFALRSGGPDADALDGREGPYDIDVVRMRFAGGCAEQSVTARNPHEGRSNYFIGNDPDQWRTGVRLFGSLESRNVYPGIDVHWRSGERSRLTYDLVVAPGADPASIALQFDGAERVTIDDDGSLVVATANGEMRHSAPVVFQTLERQRRAIDGGFVIRCDGGVGFLVGDYDSTRTLVIDPGIAYSTYVGTSSKERLYDLEVSSTGQLVPRSRHPPPISPRTREAWTRLS